MNQNVPEIVVPLPQGFNGYGYEVPRPPNIPTTRVWAGTDGYVFQKIALNPCRYGLLAVPVISNVLFNFRVWTGTFGTTVDSAAANVPVTVTGRVRPQKSHGKGHREATAKAKIPTRARAKPHPHRPGPRRRKVHLAEFLLRLGPASKQARPGKGPAKDGPCNPTNWTRGGVALRCLGFTPPTKSKRRR